MNSTTPSLGPTRSSGAVGMRAAPVSSREGDLRPTLAGYRSRLLLLSLKAAVLGWLVCLLSVLLAGVPMAPVTWLAFVAELLVFALSYAFLQSGKSVYAAYGLVVPFFPVLFVAMWGHGGLTSGSAVFIIPVVVVAAATGGTQLTLIASVLGAAVLSAFALADYYHFPLGTHPLPILFEWVQLMVALVISGAVLHGLLRSLRQLDVEAKIASREREEVASRYVTAQKLEPVGQLASGVAHDFNNLLSVMVSVSAALRQEHETIPGIDELLNDLDEATTRASLMTGQLLSFSRRRAFEPATIDLDELLSSLSPLLGRLLGDEIVVSFRGTTEGLTVEADRGQLEQVFLNLAINARDAMPKGGRLDISVGREQSMDLGVYIELKDTGEGMSTEVREKIFSAFFTTKPTGTGLGLATVQDIVQRLCGSIEVESAEGFGSTFRIVLPASLSPASPPHPSLSRHRVVRRTARILLAEDHELLRRATQRNLEQIGYAVTSVVNGQEALALLQGGATFDLLITDVSMPKLSGIDLAEKLAELRLGIPTVFISGNAGLDSSFGDRFPFPSRFLSKPFAQEDFLQAIENCIAEGRLGGTVPRGGAA